VEEQLPGAESAVLTRAVIKRVGLVASLASGALPLSTVGDLSRRVSATFWPRDSCQSSRWDFWLGTTPRHSPASRVR